MRRVILLHGLWMAGITMRPLARRLRAAGFEPEVLGYHTIRESPRAAMAALLDRLREGGPAHVVGHSMGGLVALHALRADPEARVGRVLCLGSPLCGSAAAGELSGFRLSGIYFGRSREILLEGCPRWPEGIAVGMIAGSAPYGLGRFFGHFQGDHDGTVAVAETRAPGLVDHLVVRTSHTGLLLSPEVATQAARFLRGGGFGRG
ncbi:esterase/lipase family protein [Luteimonas dalianensis]|uniref:esterase/lipase family protein n=1 Tax=Luteimonas dalianensis TaxID=1148196 RepID=UPI003BF04E6B